MSEDERADPVDATPTPRPGDTYVQSFARGLAVIRAFGADAPTQTLTEVARRTGLTRAGARRILLTLEGLGYVTAEGRRFQLSPSILELGLAYLRSQPLWPVGDALLLKLASDLQASAALWVLDGDEVVCQSRVPARHVGPHERGSGHRLPAARTAAGRVLLAEAAGSPAPASVTTDARSDAPDAPSTPATPATPDTPANRAGIESSPAPDAAPDDRIEAGATIHPLRQQGWCLVEAGHDEPVSALAVPVRDRLGRRIAALDLSLPGPEAPAPAWIEQALPRLLQTADELSASLAG